MIARLAATGAALCIAAGGSASAQASGFVRYSDSVAPLAQDTAVVGEAAAADLVRFQVTLKLRNPAVLAAGNTAGRVLTPAQLEARHLPAVQDYARVVAYLKAAGFTIEQTSPERLAVEASGTVAQVNKVMGVHFASVRRDGRLFTSADSAPAAPAAIADVVQSINGLQPQLRVHKMGQLRPMSATKTPFYPAAFIKAYHADGITNRGAKTTTAIVIDTFPAKSDLTKFWSATGVSQSLSNITFVQAVSGKLDAPSGEETLDTEIASSLAPAVKVRVYASRTLSDADLDTTFRALIHDMRAGVKITQVSISLGECESEVPKDQARTDNSLFAIMSSLGASVLVSSGDDGAKECGFRQADTPSFYATSPNVTAVGGTSLTINTASSSPYRETGWSDSGGGVSTLFASPAYQSDLGHSRRVTPDVSADADPDTGALVILDGQSYQYGGTSLSAPIWSALIALVNSARLTRGKDGVGLLNTYLYPLADTTSFRDITRGNNGFAAGPGYDLVTGLGSPLMDELASRLAAKD